MLVFEGKASIKLKKGCRTYLLAAFPFLLGALAVPAHATEHIWGCLLYASNNSKAFDLPSRMSGYDVPLRNGLGFSNYRVIAERFEFWQGRENRLHDRFLYTPGVDARWQIDRLAP